MDRIASFCVDHTTLLPGMYLSRQDGPHGEILTWDVRMKRPNQGSYLSLPPPTHWNTCLPPMRATASTAAVWSMWGPWAA